MTVAAILKSKGAQIVHVEPSARIADVAELMTRQRIGAVLVLDPGGRLLGVLSERDIVHQIAAHGAAALEGKAEEAMTRNVTTITPQTHVEEAMAIMTVGRFRHLPVLERGALVGIVSIGDVVKRLIDDKSHEVDNLKAYVVGAPQATLG